MSALSTPPSGLLAVALSAVAVVLLFSPAPRPAGRQPCLRSGLPPGLRGGGFPLFLATAVLTGAVLVLDGRRLVLATVAVLVVLAVSQQVARARRRSQAEQRAGRVMALCEGLAADLQAGQPPLRALERAAREWPELAPVAGAARLGSDVPLVLRGLAAQPGADRLRVVAAAWQVAHRSGSGLAEAMSRAASAIRHDRAVRRLVGSELAAARATARMMAGLPLVVLLVGRGVGGDPIGFLLDTPAGLGCLSLGLALSYLGILWLDRISDRVLR